MRLQLVCLAGRLVTLRNGHLTVHDPPGCVASPATTAATSTRRPRCRPEPRRRRHLHAASPVATELSSAAASISAVTRRDIARTVTEGDPLLRCIGSATGAVLGLALGRLIGLPLLPPSFGPEAWLLALIVAVGAALGGSLGGWLGHDHV